MSAAEIHSKRRLTLPISEVVIVSVILSLQFAIFLPAIDAARDRQGLPPICAWFVPFYSPHPILLLLLFPVLASTAVAALLVAVRAALPQELKAHLPWKRPPKNRLIPPKKINHSRPAIVSAVISICSTSLLVFAALHVRADRTQRHPVVTWEGLAANYIDQLAILGWALSAVALIAGIYTLRRYSSRWNGLAILACVLGCLNFLLSGLFLMAMYED